MTETLDYQPKILVETSELPHKDWLAYRRKGIGGSDTGAILGISPFRTARDIYFEKLEIVSVEEDEENWIAKEVGHLLEDLVAQIFSKRTGLKVFRRPYMYQHPLYPWMLADLDFLVEMPDGTLAVLECKTTSAGSNWWYNGKEIVPAHYESQGRHYLSVVNLNKVFFCCYVLGSGEEAIIRSIDRDKDYEMELIALEHDFWHDNVLAKKPPPYTESGDLIMESLKRTLGPADEDAPPVTLSATQSSMVARFLEMKQRKKELDDEVKIIESQMDRLKAQIVSVMGTSCKAVYEDANGGYTVTFNPSRRPIVTAQNIERMKVLHPELYAEYVTLSESRRFHAKRIEGKAA